MTPAICLCSDLDRTILPNGIQEESPGVRHALRKIAKQPGMTLVYVTGRNRSLVIDAIDEFDIPVPEYVIGDVGTTLYRIKGSGWEMVESWWQHIGEDWKDLTGPDLSLLLEDLGELQLQEPEKQSRYKLSYYTDSTVDHRRLVDRIYRRLQNKDVAAAVVWSVDEAREMGLIDILPKHATKLHAIKFFLKMQRISEDLAVFAGDSGNDMDALTSGLRAILVKNATEDVREEAFEILAKKQMPDRLYMARGDFLGMNGNYTAGVLEGLAYFFPQTEKWIREAMR